jgi:hypothetical protein
MLSGCAALEPYPSKRPLTEEHIKSLGKVNEVLAENTDGVGKSWFMTDSSAAGAQYGLIGALVTATMDAIMNYGPQKRAAQSADAVAAVVPADELNTSFVAQLRSQAQVDGAAAGGISIGDVTTTQKILAPDAVQGVVEISTTYTLSEDASAFRFVSRATYQDAKLKYATPYKFKNSVPKSELSGPLYANTFTYHSAQLPIPTLTPERSQELIASIENGYKSETGAFPAPDSKEGKAMAKELEAARDDKLTKDEIAIFLTREWVKNKGALLRQEIESAHAFAAKYILLDLNSAAVPQLDGQDELVETSSNGRTVRRVGAGIEAGSYISSPANAAAFTTYGNAVAISRVQLEKRDALRDQARPAKNKGKSKTGDKTTTAGR